MHLRGINEDLLGIYSSYVVAATTQHLTSFKVNFSPDNIQLRNKFSVRTDLVSLDERTELRCWSLTSSLPLKPGQWCPWKLQWLGLD